MAARWDIAAVIVALLAIFAQVISTSPGVLALLNRVARKTLCSFKPQGGRCRRLSWENIPPGLLHQCSPPTLCPHDLSVDLGIYDRSPPAWDETLGRVFSRAWKLMSASPLDSRFVVEKPPELSFGEDYFRIDVKMLKAYLMLRMADGQECEVEELATSLKLQSSGSIVTCQLHARDQVPGPLNLKLTKAEVDRFIEGYPPFFRENVLTTGGIQLGPMLSNTDGISKASWILAVGMSASLGPIPRFHNMQSVIRVTEGPKWTSTLILTSFKMIRRNLLYIQEHEQKYGTRPSQSRALIYRQNWSGRAIDCWDKIMSDEYSELPWPLKVQEIENSSLFEGIIGRCPCQESCIYDDLHDATCGRGQHERKDPAKILTADQCRAALQIFDNYRLSDHNLAIILPKLANILQSLMLGMSEVEHFFSNLGRKLELPRELSDHQYVYLREQC